RRHTGDSPLHVLKLGFSFFLFDSPLFVSFGAMAPNDDESVKFFLSIGLDEKTATTTINNPKVTANLTAVIHEAGVTNGCDRTTGNLLYTKLIDVLKVKTPAQLDAAVSVFDNHAPEDFKLNELRHVVLDVIDRKMYELFGEKTAADNEQSSLDDQETK
uniref:Glutaminyl-tRNA synthetase class Ib non-specific RNA-binding domain-containing protein n=1 Tax=Brassica oleracea var. oleracea TaxID=109376 RepID=A0A0D2ZS25_BRAOL